MAGVGEVMGVVGGLVGYTMLRLCAVVTMWVGIVREAVVVEVVVVGGILLEEGGEWGVWRKEEVGAEEVGVICCFGPNWWNGSGVPFL